VFEGGSRLAAHKASCGQILRKALVKLEKMPPIV
jgi:hypothetical protein